MAAKASGGVWSTVNAVVKFWLFIEFLPFLAVVFLLPVVASDVFIPSGWVSFAGCNQVPQAAVDIGAPGVRAHVVAFVCGDQTDVGKANLCFIALLRKFEDDVGALPLRLVLRK